MAAEKSLLAKIREKELEMSVKIDDARTEADQAIERARKESTVLLSSSESEGKKAATEFLHRELERIQGESDAIWAQATEEVKKVRQTGEKNTQKAVEKIVAIVLSG